MKFTLLVLLSIIFLSSCKNEVTVDKLVIDNAWKGTHGAILVRKGNLSDTVFDCNYGRAPDYSILKDNDKEYLFTSCESNGQGDNVQTFFLWSLEDETFMDTLFSKVIYTSEISSISSNIKLWTTRSADFKFNNKKISMSLDSLVLSVNADSFETIDTISKGKITYNKTIY